MTARPKKFPASPAQWEAVIAAAPGKDRPLTAAEEAKMANAVVVKKGGYAAVRAALAEKRTWLYENPKALASVRRGLDQARKGDVAKNPPDLKAAAKLAKQLED